MNLVKRTDPSLVSIYRQLGNPLLIQKLGRVHLDKGLIVYSYKRYFSVRGLGPVALGVMYYLDAKKVILVFFLSKQQIKILHNHGIRDFLKQKIQWKQEETYLCYLNEKMIKEIEQI